MKKIILVVWVFLTIAVYPQALINEKFNDFTRGEENCIAAFIFGTHYHNDKETGKQINQDLSSNSNNLSLAGWADYAALLADTISNLSYLYKGDNVIDPADAGTYLYSTDADFSLTSTWSIEFYFKLPNTGASSNGYVNKLTASGNFPGYAVRPTVTQVRIYTSNGTGGGSWSNHSEIVGTGGYHVCVWTFSSGNYTIFHNQTKFSGSGKQTPATTPGTEFRIGRDETTNESNWLLMGLRVLNVALSDKVAKEAGFLALQWNSKKGGVTRDVENHPWAQGIVADTISHSIAAGSTIGHLDAWGASGGETLSVYNVAGDVQTFELTTDSTRYTISSITFAENDSLFIGSTGTVTVDNVYLETAPAVNGAANIYANKFSIFPEFPDFLNDEAIQ